MNNECCLKRILSTALCSTACLSTAIRCFREANKNLQEELTRRCSGKSFLGSWPLCMSSCLYNCYRLSKTFDRALSLKKTLIVRTSRRVPPFEYVEFFLKLLETTSKCFVDRIVLAHEAVHSKTHVNALYNLATILCYAVTRWQSRGGAWTRLTFMGLLVQTLNFTERMTPKPAPVRSL